MACHLAGMRYTQLIMPKIENAQYARQTMSLLLEQIRAANSIQIGNGTLTNFTVAGPTSLQAGNALRIFMSTNSTQCIYYFYDPASLSLEEVPLSSTGAVVVASDITNSTVFTMEDFAGNILTNNQNNAVVGVLLQINRPSSWNGMAGDTTIHTKVTRRNIL